MKLYETAFALALALAMCSCEATDGWRLRSMAGGGFTRMNGRVGGDRGSIDGSQASIRTEVAREIGYAPNVEAGLRVGAGFRTVDETDDGVTADLDVLEGTVTPVLRGFLRVGEKTRLYAEVFGGYRHSWGDLDLSDSTGTVTVKGDNGGGILGAGLGSEFALSERNSLLLGIEWSRHFLHESGARLDVDDFSLLIGWGIKF